MSILLKQTGRVYNSVTFSIDGVTNDRQTFIWIPHPLLTNGGWLTLSRAYELGYIKDYSATSDTNGSIRIVFKDDDIEELKVWQFYVTNVSNGVTTEVSKVLDTVLEFNYENSMPKIQGSEVDITVNDIRQINLFAAYIFSFVIGEECEYYPLEGVGDGEEIYAEYLVLAATNLYNAALKTTEVGKVLQRRNDIMAYMSDITENIYSGAAFRAEYFNNFEWAINNFDLQTD